MEDKKVFDNAEDAPKVATVADIKTFPNEAPEGKTYAFLKQPIGSVPIRGAKKMYTMLAMKIHMIDKNVVEEAAKLNKKRISDRIRESFEMDTRLSVIVERFKTHVEHTLFVNRGTYTTSGQERIIDLYLDHVMGNAALGIEVSDPIPVDAKCVDLATIREKKWVPTDRKMASGQEELIKQLIEQNKQTAETNKQNAETMKAMLAVVAKLSKPKGR